MGLVGAVGILVSGVAAKYWRVVDVWLRDGWDFWAEDVADIAVHDCWRVTPSHRQTYVAE